MEEITWKEIQQKLAEPFPIEDIEFRIGSTMKDKSRGLLLAYVTNRAIMERLDDVVGTQNWKDTFERLSIEKGFMCHLSIRGQDGEWITKVDGADDSNMEPFKGGISGAEKRAGVKWGIGRYLYNLDAKWVAMDGNYPAKGEEQRIRNEFPAWALPGGSGKPSTPTTPADTPPPPSSPPHWIDNKTVADKFWAFTKKLNLTPEDALEALRVKISIREYTGVKAMAITALEAYAERKAAAIAEDKQRGE